MRDAFRAIERELNESYLERREPIRGLLVGLLARQHVLLLGPPGTAKSAMAEDLCGRVGGTYFRWLLARTSTPEELFGPVSLRALEADSYRRVTTGKLPEAHVAFLDEVWKCNSAVLNSLLGVLNERHYHNDGAPTPVPLEMAVAASNELPADREELGALWDRFGLRYVVTYIRDPRSFDALLAGQAPATRTTIAMADLAAAQAEVRAVNVRPIIPVLAGLRAELAQKNVQASDRRWRQCLALVQASAWLDGRQTAAVDDLGILAAALWQDPAQVTEVRQVILRTANPLDLEAQDLLDQGCEVYQAAIRAEAEKATKAGVEANAKLRAIGQRLDKLGQEARGKGRDDGRILDALRRVQSMNKEIIEKCLGVAAQ